MKTNILVQYQGGGYSGCFWEWNYFYIDKQGTFHDIYSSGSAGIDTIQGVTQLLDQNNSHTYIYNLNNKQDIEAFSKKCNVVHVQAVLQWFKDNGVEFFAVCSACDGHIVNTDDLIVEGNNILCYECYSIGHCPCCESYVGDTKIVKVNSDEHHCYNYICTDCKEYHDDERAEQKLEDLRWQSFCTGKPDMFSKALREWWLPV
jgi:hypothetical protein